MINMKEYAFVPHYIIVDTFTFITQRNPENVTIEIT